MNVSKKKLSDFHKVFKYAGIGKKHLHVYPDGLIRIKLDEKKTAFKYLYIEENLNARFRFNYALTASPDRNNISWYRLRDFSTTSFDPIFEIITELAPDNIQTIILFNMERM